MMKRIVFLMLIILLLSSCHMKKDDDTKQTMYDLLNEPIDFTKVKQLDFDNAVAAIEEEIPEVYIPEVDQMYRAVRSYKYNIQNERAWIESEYEFDEQKDRYFSTTINAYYSKAEKRSFTERTKEYMWHLIKKIGNNSTRINQNGFKGYYALHGAKLDSRRFNIEKDGYMYNFSPLSRTPDGFENFNFVEYTINSLRKADEFDEWDEIKDTILTKVHLPDASAYQPILLSFKQHYKDINKNEVEYIFDNDDSRFEFGAYEDGIDFEMPTYAYGIELRNIEEDVSTRTLSNGLLVSRHIFYKLFDFKWVVYTWDMDGLHYYIAVKDERVEKPDDLEKYELEYLRLIESVDKP